VSDLTAIIDAVHSAAANGAKHMTSGVRSSAMGAGWPLSAATSLSVSAVGTSFTVSGSDDAADWEYGNSTRTPAAAVHQYSQRTGDAESAMLKEIEATLKSKGIL